MLLLLGGKCQIFSTLRYLWSVYDTYAVAEAKEIVWCKRLTRSSTNEIMELASFVSHSTVCGMSQKTVFTVVAFSHHCILCIVFVIMFVLQKCSDIKWNFEIIPLLQKYHVCQKTAPFYFCNNFVKPSSIFIVFGIRIRQ